MKAKLTIVILVGIMASSLSFGEAAVQAQAESQALSGVAMDNLFLALNEGNTDGAVAAFVHEALVVNRVNHETYSDLTQITGLLGTWQHDGRRYALISKEVLNVARGLDIIQAEVEMTDRGVRWGRQTVLALVHNGQIHRLDVTRVQLTLWQPSSPTGIARDRRR